jgi:hypothetical protein
MRMMEMVESLERVLMPHFQEIREGLCADYPEFEHRVYSNSGGDLTPHPWHVMGVSCLLHRDWGNPPNEVMLMVAALSLKSEPTIEAYVMWDYLMISVGEGFSRRVPFSAEVIVQVEKALPELVEVLKGAVRRGHPPASLARVET